MPYGGVLEELETLSPLTKRGDVPMGHIRRQAQVTYTVVEVGGLAGQETRSSEAAMAAKVTAQLSSDIIPRAVADWTFTSDLRPPCLMDI